MVVVRSLLTLFLLSRNLVRNLANTQVGDHRAMIRSSINMLVWNLVAVIVVVTL